MSMTASSSSPSSSSDPFDPLRLSSISSIKACPVCLTVISVKSDEDPDTKLQEHMMTAECLDQAGGQLPPSRDTSRAPPIRGATSTSSTSTSSSSSSSSSSASSSLSSPPPSSMTLPPSSAGSYPFDSTPSRPNPSQYPLSTHPTHPIHPPPTSSDQPGAEDSDTRSSADSVGEEDRTSHFEEDEDAGALQWSKLQPLDKSDDTTGGGGGGGAAGGGRALNEVAAAALLSGGLTAGLKAEPRNGERGEGDSHTPSSAPPRSGAPFSPFPIPNITSVFSPSSNPNKRNHHVVTSSNPSSASATPTASSKPSLHPPSTSSRKRRKKEDEENSVNLAYERQISTLNEAIRQLLAYVSPLHSHTDTLVDGLIAAYRGEYMKEQLREGRTVENKKYARALAAYTLTYYHNPNMNVQLALQHLIHPPQTQNGGASSPTSTPAKAGEAGADGAAEAPPSTAPSTATSPTGAATSSTTGSPSNPPVPSPKDLLLQRIPLDPWEGLSHPLYPNLTLLLYTIIDALLMDTLQITLFSLYLERLEPFFILEASPSSQARLLLIVAYAMKLAYMENHSIFLPYLTGLYSNFSKLFADYIHSKPGVRLGIGNVALTNRFRLFGGLREKE